jgi:hypothetical protein
VALQRPVLEGVVERAHDHRLVEHEVTVTDGSATKRRSNPAVVDDIHTTRMTR